MADPSSSRSASTDDLGLKHLEFARHALISLYILLFKLYEQAKGNSGSLRTGIDRVESVVRTVVGPVWSKVEEKPDELFRFADEKVDAALKYADSYIPKDLAHRASDFVRAVPVRAKEALYDCQEKGALGAAKSYYYESLEPVLSAYLVFLWRLALSMPLVPHVVVAASPIVFAAAGKYNSVVASLQKSGFQYVKKAADVVPLVPVEKAESYVKLSLQQAGVECNN
ncbi:hypothetical protein CLOM_g17495 [Closterium sp. NIES-68]|nr:hypothetical protein CLOM_g17495 [Closterium sp. NIES-68]GJP86501.1 hypothetical protein CLOP_g16520 [Closterium sp. NIES-67]